MAFNFDTAALDDEKCGERRGSSRICRSKQVMLELSKNRTVLGMTENVSRGGAFVHVESPMWSLSPGVTCTLRMPGRSAIATWPCRLVRTNRTGVGIEILEDIVHFLGACDLPVHSAAFQ